MKKIILLMLIIISLVSTAFGDSFLMLGINLGSKITTAHFDELYISAQLSGQHYFGNDGTIGIGTDIKPFTEIKLKNENIIGITLSPSIQLKLSLFEEIAKAQIKLFPSFSFINSNNKDGHFIVGGGLECFVDFRTDNLGTKGGGIFATIEIKDVTSFSKEKNDLGIFISIGPKFYLRNTKIEKKDYEKETELKAAANKIRQEKAEEARIKAEQEKLKAEELRQEKENQKISAELAAIKSGSLDEMRKYAYRYGYSENIIIAIENYLSNNQNTGYKELDYFENPYSFDKENVYYCKYMSVYQWLSEYAFLGNVNGKIIYVETINIKDIEKQMTNLFLLSTGTESYTATAGNLNIVPKFLLLLFD